MSWWKIAAIVFSVFITFAFIHYSGKNKHPFKRALFSMFLGLAVLFVVNLTGSFTGVTLPVSSLSLAVSLVGGVPGVTLLLFLNLIL